MFYILNSIQKSSFVLKGLTKSIICHIEKKFFCYMFFCYMFACYMFFCYMFCSKYPNILKAYRLKPHYGNQDAGEQYVVAVDLKIRRLFSFSLGVRMTRRER